MATTYLSRTFTASATGEQQFTLSMWVKRSSITATQFLFNAYSDTNNYTGLYFDGADKLVFSSITGGSDTGNLTTNRVFRDTSAFYNIVAVWDSNNGTPGDRMKLYVNGVEETSFATDTNPSSGQDSFVGDSGKNCLLGYKGETGFYFDGLMTHVQLVDSAALAPTEFGQVDATSGIWKIKTSCYATPGTNGFCLKMETTSGSGMGTDSSGEGNNLTASGSPTQTVDNPSNVMCTFNPLDNYYDSSTFANGNTTVSTSTAGYSCTMATIGLTKGKWFWETKYVSKTGGNKYPLIGIASTPVTAVNQELGEFVNDWGYLMDNTASRLRNNDASIVYGSNYTEGDIIGVGLDLDNNNLYFALNGTWVNSGVPTSGGTGTGAVSITAPASTPLGAYFPAVGYWDGTYGGTFQTNFGNGYFGTTIISSAGASSTDDDSIWEYDCPTAFYGLNTNNINTYG